MLGFWIYDGDCLIFAIPCSPATQLTRHFAWPRPGALFDTAGVL